MEQLFERIISLAENNVNLLVTMYMINCIITHVGNWASGLFGMYFLYRLMNFGTEVIKKMMDEE
jgi:hypothetical protein